jgi:hypothetical protein
MIYWYIKLSEATELHFVSIIVMGEIIGVLQNTNEIALLSPVITSTIMLLPDISLQIHVVSMIFLSSMLWIRFYYSEKSQKQLIDKITYSSDNNNNSLL